MDVNPIASYLHLNSSFSDHLSLMKGKSAAVLYFSVLEGAFYADDISFSFTEEILGRLVCPPGLWRWSGQHLFGAGGFTAEDFAGCYISGELT